MTGNATEHMAAHAVSSPSWFETIKSWMSDIGQKVSDSKGLILDIVLFFGVGFLIGFFLRRYGQYVAALIVFCVCLIILAQLGVVDIAINWHKIQGVLGAESINNPESGALLNLYWQWIKKNVFCAASFCVGFLVGLRMS